MQGIFPVFQSVTSTTITLEIKQPLKPNGVIVRYQIYKDGQQIPVSCGVLSQMFGEQTCF